MEQNIFFEKDMRITSHNGLDMIIIVDMMRVDELMLYKIKEFHAGSITGSVKVLSSKQLVDSIKKYLIVK